MATTKIHLELPREEAQVLADVVGDIRGAGPTRETCDAIFSKLTEAMIAAEGPISRVTGSGRRTGLTELGSTRGARVAADFRTPAQR